jgi:peptidoglycan hydrolase-like protein with peptidoglycan-binding domain
VEASGKRPGTTHQEIIMNTTTTATDVQRREPQPEPGSSRARTIAVSVTCAVVAAAVTAGLVLGFGGATAAPAAAPSPAPAAASAAPNDQGVPAGPTSRARIEIPAAPEGVPAHHVRPAPPAPPTPPAPSAAVSTLQRELGQLNYYEGPITGTMNSQTEQAITYLQRDAHLPQTGTMNAATQQALVRFLAQGNNQMGS